LPWVRPAERRVDPGTDLAATWLAHRANQVALSTAFRGPWMATARQNKKIKPIEGSWFEFQHVSAV
jgi:hypothetical protein